MLADDPDYIVVDTHRDQHVLAVVVVPTGAVIAQRSVAATARGYPAALRFADEFAPGRRLWAIEGSGHFGAGLVPNCQTRGGPDRHPLASGQRPWHRQENVIG